MVSIEVVMIDLESKAFDMLAKEIQEEIDAQFLREIDCVARNWTRVNVEFNFYTYTDAVEWCREHYPNEFNAIDLYKFYFAKPEHATHFILRWL